LLLLVFGTLTSLVGAQSPDRDGDGVPDADDRCPSDVGLSQNDGCPDSDNDSVVDIDDACPTVFGPTTNNGCPDPNDDDGDGTLNPDDDCPVAGGPDWNNGCPEGEGSTTTPDRPILPESGPCQIASAENVRVNVRALPLLTADVIANLDPSQLYTVDMQLAGEGGIWWHTVNPDGWVFDGVIRKGGDCDPLRGYEESQPIAHGDYLGFGRTTTVDDCIDDLTWLFHGIEGQTIDLIATPLDGDPPPTLRLTAPDGSNLGDESSSLPNIPLPADGMYHVYGDCDEGGGGFQLDLDIRINPPKVFRMTVIVDMTSEPFDEIEALMVVQQASVILMERTGFKTQMIDFVQMWPNAPIDRLYLAETYFAQNQLTLIPNGLVVATYGSPSSPTTTYGGYSVIYNALAPNTFVNEFHGLGANVTEKSIYGIVMHWKHRFGGCGYGEFNPLGDPVSAVSIDGECRNQQGTTCVMNNGYSMCETLIDDLYASSESYFRSATILHEIMHPFGTLLAYDHFGTAECIATMGWGDSVPPEFDAQVYNGMCPHIFDNFVNSWQPE
jgi:hypothetical protein